MVTFPSSHLLWKLEYNEPIWIGCAAVFSALNSLEERPKSLAWVI